MTGDRTVPAVTQLVTYVSPCRARNEGHYEIYTDCLIQAFQALGMRALVGLGKHWREYSEFRQLCRHEIYDPGHAYRGNSLLYRLPRKFLVGVSLGSFFRRHVKAHDVLFIDQPSAEDIVGLLLAAPLLRRRRSRVWVMLRSSEQSTNERITLKGLRLLGAYLKKGMRFISDSTVVAQDLAMLGNIALLPIPHTPNMESPTNFADRKIRFWWAGAPRPAKGQRHVENLLMLTHGAESVVLAMPDTGARAPSGSSLKTEFLSKYLTAEQYAARFAWSDVILLPYDPLIYRSGTSGIFIETVFAGKMPFVMSGTWMAAILEQHRLPELVLSENDWQAPDFWQRTGRTVMDPSVQDRLQILQHALALNHGPQAFHRKIDQLLLDDHGPA